MDFMLNRIYDVEKSISVVDNFIKNIKEKNTDQELLEELEIDSVEKELNSISSNLRLLKMRIKNNKVVKKSSYYKLKQMKKQYDDLARYLSSKREEEFKDQNY